MTFYSEIRCIAQCALQTSKDFWVFLFRQSSQRTSQETHVYLFEFKRSWFVIRDWWIRFVCFVFQGSLLCDRPVLGNNRLVKFASKIFLVFLFLVTCKNKATPVSFLPHKNLLTIAISFAILEQCRVILSQAGRACYCDLY